MKQKQKMIVRGKPLFKFEHRDRDALHTVVPTTWTMTITTTGFSKDHRAEDRVQTEAGDRV